MISENGKPAIEGQDVVNVLSEQRNAAMNAAAHLEAEKMALQRYIAVLEKKVAETARPVETVKSGAANLTPPGVTPV